MNRKRIWGAAIAILLSVTLIFGTQVNSASAGEIPIGTINPYAGLVDGTARGKLESQGWLVCDGATVSRSIYEELFDTIGGSFGVGDNVNTFNLPDLRGRFVRGVDNGTNQDKEANERIESGYRGNIGDHVGSLQETQTNNISDFDLVRLFLPPLPTIDHDTDYLKWSVSVPDEGGPDISDWGNLTEEERDKILLSMGVTSMHDTISGPSAFSEIQLYMKKKGVETHPVNVSVNWIIKALDVD